MLRLHRGIAVAGDCVDQVIASIEAEGLTVVGPRRRVEVWPMTDPRRFLVGDLNSIDRLPGDARPAVCAADLSGATHYACHHNWSARECVPLMIEFDAPPEGVCVDGNDLLYRMFSQHARIDAARPALAVCYGEAILHYADRAWVTDDFKLRNVLCDLSVWDADVIAAHHANRLLIKGKHKTLFRSAFKVMLPVPSTAIVSVRRIEFCPAAPPPDISIEALTL